MTVQNEAIRDLWSTNEGGPSLFGLLGSLSRYKKFLSCLGCSCQPGTKYFFLSIHYFHSFGKLHRQSCRAACLLMCVCGRSTQTCLCKPTVNNKLVAYDVFVNTIIVSNVFTIATVQIEMMNSFPILFIILQM